MGQSTGGKIAIDLVTDPDYTAVPFVITNVGALVIVITAMFWPTVSRILLSILFIAACVVNASTAMQNPSIYIEFGEITPSGYYRSIIMGPFAEHVQWYIYLIATCQLFIGVFIAYKGQLMKAAMAGAIVFLIAISPLGYGSAFPAPLILAAALATLLSKRIELTLFQALGRRRKYLNS